MAVMRRRDFLPAAGAAAMLLPRRVGAQPGFPIVGYLSNRSAEAEAPRLTAFLDGLEQAGFVAGRNVVIEYRFADGRPDRMPALVADLIRLPAAVLVGLDAGAAVVAKKATATIPIVFGSGPDPVQLGLVANLSRPGGNATGVGGFAVQMVLKRLELLRELVPQGGLITLLIDPRVPSAPAVIREVEAAAQAVGQPIVILHGQGDAEISTAFATLVERQVRGLLFGNSTYFQAVAEKLVGLAARCRIPAVYEWRDFVDAGGLMSYNEKRGGTARIAGEYVGRILKGASPADLPVVQATKFELVINLKTARSLGLTMPQSLLARADEVIEEVCRTTGHTQLSGSPSSP